MLRPIIFSSVYVCGVVTGVGGEIFYIDVCLDPISCPFPLNTSDPENCTMYFTCDWESLYPHPCPPGTTFHQNALQCLSSQPSCHIECLRDQSYKKHIVYPTTQAPLTTTEANG